MAFDNSTIKKLNACISRHVDKMVEAKKIEYISPPVVSNSKNKPFHKALLPNELLRFSDFERSFSTMLGKIFEECATIIAKPTFKITREYNLAGKIPTQTNAEIDRIITEINNGNLYSNYIDEVTRIIKFSQSDTSPLVDKNVISDLYITNEKNDELFFEIKSPKPNKEQCLNITRKHLWIHCMRQQGFPKTRTYFAMPYNPYGEGKKYKHSFAIKYLDIDHQVLIGKEFWDLLGGKGAYEDMLSVFAGIGKIKAKAIRNVLQVNFKMTL